MLILLIVVGRRKLYNLIINFISDIVQSQLYKYRNVAMLIVLMNEDINYIQKEEIFTGEI